MKKIAILFVLFSFVFCLNAQKKELRIEAKITDVTVYTSCAEMFYEQEVQLNSGKNAIVFTGLSSYIEDNTINVSIEDFQVNIITVTDKINYLIEKKNDNARVYQLKDSIKHIERKLGLINCEIEALKMEKDILFKGETIGGLKDGIAMNEIIRADTFFSKRYKQINIDLFNLQDKESIYIDKKSLYQNQIKQLSVVQSETSSEINVVVYSPVKKKVKVKFKYLTSKAGWAPVYDIKYQGPDQAIEFIMRANVFNACDINWDEVNVKLSTADPTQGFNIPSFNSGSSDKVNSIDYKNQKVEFKSLEVSNIIAEYDVKHQYSIPSDAKPYLIDVTSYQMNATFNYLLIPKLDSYGFLMAKIPDWNKYNLMPGTTNVYNKGTYMGKTFLYTYAENDTLSVYLGKDKKVHSRRFEDNQYNSRVIIGNNTVDETKIRIEIMNNYDQPLSIEVLDQVPFIDKYDKVKMQVYNIESAEYDEDEGLLTWRSSIQPGEKIELNFKYVIKAPKEIRDRIINAGSVRKQRFRTISCPAF